MSRTKGAKGKHNKEKPVKEKKKRGRPSKQHQKQHQQQKQIVNVNVNSDGGGSSRKPQIPIQIPSTIFDPSLIAPRYGINDRQPSNPLTDPSIDLMTPLLQAMIANQKQNQQQQIVAQPKPQPVITTQPTQPKPQPVITTQPTQPTPQPIPQPIQPIPQPIQPKKPKPIKQPENPPIIIPPKPEKPAFTHEDVQHLIDEIHQKQKKEIPEPIPQNTPDTEESGINWDLSLIKNKYDGLKLKNRTMPWSKVASGAALGVAGGVAGGMAGASILNNAIVSAGTYIGYQVAGEPGAAIGGILSSNVADKMNPSYKPSTKKPTESHEETSSYSQQRVNGGTVVETRNIKQREPSYKEPKQKKLLISRLGDAIKDVTPSNRAPPSQKIKESKLLFDLENKQKTYGTVQQSDVQPQEPKQSTFTQITEGARDIYRRLSGQKKGQYTQLPTTDDTDVDFKTTLEKSKNEGQTKGTYAILPQDDPGLDFEAEIEAMNRRARTRTRRPQGETTSLMDQIVGTPNPPWPAMQQFKTQNEKNIRKSIARTDQAEKEERIKQGLSTPQTKPPRAPRTPKQQLAINNFGALVSKSQEQQKESHYKSILQKAEPLIFKREMKRATKIVDEKVSGYTSKIAELEREKEVLMRRQAKLKPDVEKQAATTLQKAMRNKSARNALLYEREKKAYIEKATDKIERKIARAEKQISDLRLNINEQRPKGLRQAVKKLQDRRSELVNRAPNMDRKLKMEELRNININEDQYKDVIIEERRGPKVRGIIEQFGGAKKKK